MNVRSFHFGDILSVATGKLVSPRHIDGVYDVCNFMTGDNLFTHQLPRASKECAPEIYRQHPDLRDVEFPACFDSEAEVWSWLAVQVERFGEFRDLSPLPDGDHTQINPLEELAMNYPNTKVVPVVLDGDF